MKTRTAPFMKRFLRNIAMCRSFKIPFMVVALQSIALNLAAFPACMAMDAQPGSQKQADMPLGYTPEKLQAIQVQNEAAGLQFEKRLDRHRELKYRPYADYEKVGYLIMNRGFNYNSEQAKLEIARRLPPDATLVIYAGSVSQEIKKEVVDFYSSVLPEGRIKLIALKHSDPHFWSRDSMPLPVLDKSGKLVLVGAKNGNFNAVEALANIFSAGFEKLDCYFPGGNFQANHVGDCLTVGGLSKGLSDSFFSAMYGCRQVIRLPNAGGIGHVDERVRFISEKVLVTDNEKYKSLLEAKGFQVHLLPKAAGDYETYVNSLTLNDQVIVPTYGRETDAQALAVYRSLGLNATGVPSGNLSNDGHGSLHCITMTYPPAPFTELLEALDAAAF